MATRTQLSVEPDLHPASFSHGVVAAWGPQDAFLVTSPNVPYIPEIIQGIVSVYLRDNGTFGKPDPLLWPQVYTSQYPYLAAIPKGIQPHLWDTSPLSFPDSAIWAHPSLDHFVPLCNTPIRGFGRWSPGFLLALEPVVKDMSHRAQRYSPPSTTVSLKPLRQYEQQMTMAWLRLCHVYATYRDQVVQLAAVQRNWRLCSAFMTYYNLVSQTPSPHPLPVDYGLMGAWTSEPNEVQKLLSLGIPVWWVRASHIVSADTRVRQFVAFSSAAPVCHPISGCNIPIYQGLAGAHHLEVTFSIPSYMDLARVPSSCICDPEDYRAIARRDTPLKDLIRSSPPPSVHSGYSKVVSLRGARIIATPRPSPYSIPRLQGSKLVHSSHARGRDKFLDPSHRWMPPPLSGWDRAMHAIDRSRVANPTEDLWGYWIPEPALLLGGKDPARQQRYLLNWLRAQPVWLYMLQIPGSGAVKIRPQSWRDFLNGVPDNPTSFTRTGKRFYEIRQIFGRIFEEVEMDASADGEVEWHQRRVTFITEDLAPLIVWETFELGFRYELWALDRFTRPVKSPLEEADRTLSVAQVFTSNSLWVVPDIPTADESGLFATLPHRRINSLNAFRDILTGWRRCPQTILDARPLQISDTVEVIEELEFRLASFYIQTFFEASGRAPIVPHALPRTSWIV